MIHILCALRREARRARMWVGSDGNIYDPSLMVGTVLTACAAVLSLSISLGLFVGEFGLLAFAVSTGSMAPVRTVVLGTIGPGPSGRMDGPVMSGTGVAFVAINDNSLAIWDMPKLSIMETLSMIPLALAESMRAMPLACDATAERMAASRPETSIAVGVGMTGVMDDTRGGHA